MNIGAIFVYYDNDIYVLLPHQLVSVILVFLIRIFIYALLQRLLRETEPSELLYFADICAGPGGFSEYVLWRRKWEAKGFGFTLKGSNDFKLEEFHAAPSEFFEPHYGKF